MENLIKILTDSLPISGVIANHMLLMDRDNFIGYLDLVTDNKIFINSHPIEFKPSNDGKIVIYRDDVRLITIIYIPRELLAYLTVLWS